MAITQINSSKPLTIKGTKFIKSFAGIDEYKLANGLRVILKPNTNVPMISFQVWYKVGSRNESLGLTGLAHYLEHIMFKGTKQFGKGEIAQSITLKGGIFNAFTSDDYTAYFENFSPENLELAIKIESDRMQNSRLDFEEVELERSVIVSELEGNRNQPQNNLYEIMRSAAFNVHTYRNPVIGWKEDLNNINANNMRDFYQTYYYPDNARVVLVGNFDHELALTLIEKYFGQYKPRNKEFPVLTPEPEQKALKQVTIYNGGNSKLLGIAYHIPEFKNKDSVALHILADILFGGMTSRLYPKLVDSGLCNDISGAAESNIDASMFRILINLNPEADPKEVEQIIDREFELVKNNINIEELNLSKAREESSFVYQADGVYDEGLQLGFFDIVAGDWTRYVTWLDDVKACSIDDVQRVAKQYFKPDNKTLVVSLPNKSPEALIPIQETTTITGNESGLDSKVHANYGANVVEPLSPEKLAKLNKLTEAKFSKKAVFPKMQLDFKSLDLGYSGWKVFHKQDSNLPLIFGNIYLYGGSANDTTRPGISYLTSQMLTRGSKFKDKYEISKLTDIYGSDIGFSSTKETARISFSSISKNIDEVVSLLDEVLKNPRFDQAELDKLKAQTIAQIKQEDDYPQRISRRDITRLIYPVGHPYYLYSPQEKIESIQKITIDDIKEFYFSNYNSKNLNIAIVGDISESKTKDIIHKLFDNLNSDGNHAALKGNNRPAIENVATNDPQNKVIVMNDKEQVEITLGHALPVNRASKDFYPLYIANQALGGSALSSRLGFVVRDEHGYVYNVRTSFTAALGADMFQVVLGCNPKNTTNAIELTKKVIKDFLKSGINDTELAITKAYLIDSFAPRALASNEDIAETLSQIQLYELGEDYISKYKQNVNSIDKESVNEAARRLIDPDKLHSIVVGPQ